LKEENNMKKDFVAGALSALLLVSVVGTASAAVGKRTAQLDYNNIKVTLNGSQVNLVDVNGNPVEPFAIEGTTYLPVRAVSGALGLDVEWDANTSTVVLTDGTAQTGTVQPGTGSNAANLGNYYVEITGAKIVQDHNGKKSIVITCKWTNNSKVPTSAFATMCYRAFQNGVQLNNAVVTSDVAPGVDNNIRSVQPGGTLEVQYAYSLDGTNAAVEFVMYNLKDYLIDDISERVYASFDVNSLS
jgi:hypothetical protein